MWKPIDDAARDGRTVWVGNSETGEMRLARWGENGHLHWKKAHWIDVVINDTLGPAEVRIMPDVYTEIPTRPSKELVEQEQLVDRLAEIFWQAHRQPMLDACNDIVDALNGEEERNENLKEAVRIGIRAVLNELKRPSSPSG